MPVIVKPSIDSIILKHPMMVYSSIDLPSLKLDKNAMGVYCGLNDKSPKDAKKYNIYFPGGIESSSKEPGCFASLHPDHFNFVNTGNRFYIDSNLCKVDADLVVFRNNSVRKIPCKFYVPTEESSYDRSEEEYIEVSFLYDPIDGTTTFDIDEYNPATSNAAYYLSLGWVEVNWGEYTLAVQVLHRTKIILVDLDALCN